LIQIVDHEGGSANQFVVRFYQSGAPRCTGPLSFQHLVSSIEPEVQQAQNVLAREQHNDAVAARRDPAMRRRAMLERTVHAAVDAQNVRALRLPKTRSRRPRGETVPGKASVSVAARSKSRVCGETPWVLS
jgi:hypothetical protein